jgi:hypothetical protein
MIRCRQDTPIAFGHERTQRLWLREVVRRPQRAYAPFLRPSPFPRRGTLKKAAMVLFRPLCRPARGMSEGRPGEPCASLVTVKLPPASPARGDRGPGLGQRRPIGSRAAIGARGAASEETARGWLRPTYSRLLSQPSFSPITRSACPFLGRRVEPPDPMRRPRHPIASPTFDVPRPYPRMPR